MLFCENPEDRFYERLMKTVPVRRKKDVFGTAGYLDNVLFDIIRFNEESEDFEIMFRNEKHKTVFEEAVRKKDKKDYALMATIYLLTADLRLWNIAKHHVEKTVVDFGSIKLKGIHESGYTLFCGAKDIYTESRNLCIADLVDKELIPPKIFGLLCNAMVIRRCGLAEISKEERMEKHDSGNRKIQ